MNKIREKIKKIELIESTTYYTEFVDGFMEIRNEAEGECKEVVQKLAQYEIDICSFFLETPIITAKKNESRFIPKYGYPDGTNWPEVKMFEVEQFKYYEKRLLETDNLFLKMRYSYFLFEFGDKNIEMNKYQISKHLLENLLEVSNYYKINSGDFEYVSTIASLVEVSLLMGNKEKLREAIYLIHLQLNECNNKKDYAWVLEYSKILREVLHSKLKQIVTEEITTFIIDILNKAKNLCLENKEYNLHRLLCEELINYKRLDLISDEQKVEYQLEIGKNYELESEYQHGREKKSLIVKAYYLEEAMSHYANIGYKEKVDEMKQLIRKTYDQLEQSDEMKIVSSPVEIPRELVGKLVDSYVSSNIQDSLDKIALSPIIPDIDEIAKQVNDLKEEFPLQNLISKSILDNSKKIEHSETEDDLYRINFNQNYVQRLDLGIELILLQVFEKLVHDYNFNLKDIMEKFNQWGLLSENNYFFVEVGVSRFFEEDYVSAIHILVPQFESTLRNLFVQADFATTSIKKRTNQHEQTFNEFLDREDVKSSLGDNIHKLIQIVMVEQSGLNLRNNIAHGLIDFASMTKSRCILVIFLFLILTRYEIKSSE